MILLNNVDCDHRKCGTITISVYKDKSNHHFFEIQSDTEDVLPVSYVIEDTLSFY